MELHNYIVWRWAVFETSRDLLKNIRRGLSTIVFQACQVNMFAILFFLCRTAKLDMVYGFLHYDSPNTGRFEHSAPIVVRFYHERG